MTSSVELQGEVELFKSRLGTYSTVKADKLLLSTDFLPALNGRPKIILKI